MSDRPPLLARLLTANGRSVVGARILVDTRHVVTCAHVVDQALGRRREKHTPPDQPVKLDLMEAYDSIAVPARAVRWLQIEQNQRRDFCVLKMNSDAPAGTQLAPAAPPGQSARPPFRHLRVCEGSDTGIASQEEIGQPAQATSGRSWRESALPASGRSGPLAARRCGTTALVGLTA